ncbi:DNA-binding protein [Massilia sp.]|uniref:DNA-binding protein n=1 Tax=Massilia sp. TaxID=1882437 RepID=UPI0028B1E6E3|nr:DNA-binding protein [Massilia sp.]
MLEHNDLDAALQVDVEKLRGEYPRTLDLYKEVCVVMFFRYGMTPTANKLYQLVRKGSMSAPTEALRAFWAGLRRSGKVELGQADLPEDLAHAAGDLVSKLWSSAQAAASESLEELRKAAGQERDSALRDKQSIQGQLDAVKRELQELAAKLELASRENATLREEAAVSAAAAVEMSSKLSDARQAASEAAARLEGIRTEHAAEIEKITARITQAEERYAASEHRALLEIDRERTAATRLEKALESERSSSAASLQRLQSELTHAQIDAAKQARDFAALEENLRSAIEERNNARDLAPQLRATISDLTVQVAAERARAEVLDEQLNRLSSKRTRTVKPGQQRRKRAAQRSKAKPSA